MCRPRSLEAEAYIDAVLSSNFGIGSAATELQAIFESRLEMVDEVADETQSEERPLSLVDSQTIREKKSLREDFHDLVCYFSALRGAF